MHLPIITLAASDLVQLRQLQAVWFRKGQVATCTCMHMLSRVATSLC